MATLSLEVWMFLQTFLRKEIGRWNRKSWDCLRHLRLLRGSYLYSILQLGRYHLAVVAAVAMIATVAVRVIVAMRATVAIMAIVAIIAIVAIMAVILQ